MKKVVLFAAVAGLGLVSASPPEGDHRIDNYPPCSATVTDQCIQLYERGVRRETHPTETAHPAPVAGGGEHYPPCTATRKDECRQQRALARRVRMAGERG